MLYFIKSVLFFLVMILKGKKNCDRYLILCFVIRICSKCIMFRIMFKEYLECFKIVRLLWYVRRNFY